MPQKKVQYCFMVLLILLAIKSSAQNQHKPTAPSERKSHIKPGQDTIRETTTHKHRPDTTKVYDDSLTTYTHYEGHKHKHSQEHHHHGADSTHMMSSAFSLNLPMNRNGSGTGWNPDATPIFAYMLHKKNWMFMFHGNMFVRYNSQDITEQGSRGGAKWDAPNMLMAMAQRKVGRKGLFHANMMLSTDPIITGGSGYPLLFQTGETWKGKPLVDRQHPHDLFSELSVSYAYSFNRNSDIFIYIGYPGEPALGPVTFLHRPLGNFLPDAPLGHHWQDATHITFGTATLGYRYGKFKLEVSSFTGREPDEKRYNFDKPLFDSWSGRLSFNPTANWSMQVSHGALKSPEALHPEDDVDRTTASVSYVYHFCGNRYIAVNAVIGRNSSHGITSYCWLTESTYKLSKTVFYLRFEGAQRTASDLALDPIYYGSKMKYNIYTPTVGAAYDILQLGGIMVAAGAQGTIYLPDDVLKPLYGQNPLGGEIYLHFYPKQLQ